MHNYKQNSKERAVNYTLYRSKQTTMNTVT